MGFPVHGRLGFRRRFTESDIASGRRQGLSFGWDVPLGVRDWHQPPILYSFLVALLP